MEGRIWLGIHAKPLPLLEHPISFYTSVVSETSRLQMPKPMKSEVAFIFHKNSLAQVVANFFLWTGNFTSDTIAATLFLSLSLDCLWNPLVLVLLEHFLCQFWCFCTSSSVCCLFWWVFFFVSICLLFIMVLFLLYIGLFWCFSTITFFCLGGFSAFKSVSIGVFSYLHLHAVYFGVFPPLHLGWYAWKSVCFHLNAVCFKDCFF